uniref:Reverse transcriptase domain-containing protein n=1 Tax=Oreochromis aureus TaxID=47969 RepID=A0AAZ1XP43_OREAU
MFKCFKPRDKHVFHINSEAATGLNSERIYLVQPTTHYKLRGPAGPQGCVLSPILFSVHTNNIFIQDCLCKYASNAALVGLSRRVKANPAGLTEHQLQNYFKQLNNASVNRSTKQHFLLFSSERTNFLDHNLI